MIPSVFKLFQFESKFHVYIFNWSRFSVEWFAIRYSSIDAHHRVTVTPPTHSKCQFVNFPWLPFLINYNFTWFMKWQNKESTENIKLQYIKGALSIYQHWWQFDNRVICVRLMWKRCNQPRRKINHFRLITSQCIREILDTLLLFIRNLCCMEIVQWCVVCSCANEEI